MSNEDLAMAVGEQLTVSDKAAEAQRVSQAHSTVYCKLAEHAIFSVTGADATEFLQGQFCNDISNVSTTQAQITGYCTPKGRLLALPVIVGFSDGYRLVVPVDVATAFIKRLTMFVLRSDVHIKQLEDWSVIGIIAQTADELSQITTGAGELSEDVMSVSTDETSQLIRWHDDQVHPAKKRSRYLRLAPAALQNELWSDIEDTSKCGATPWRLADVSAGIPSIHSGVVESFVPQMINLQLIDGLSFTKGCYPGQEIVARMQYLGKLKRHMRVFTIAMEFANKHVLEQADALLQPGQSLTSGTDENAGIVVDAVPMSDTSALVLAVTKVGSPDSVFNLGGYPLTAREMPYELPSLEVA